MITQSADNYFSKGVLRYPKNTQNDSIKICRAVRQSILLS